MAAVIILLIPIVTVLLFMLVLKGIAYLAALIIAEGVLRTAVTHIVSILLAVLGFAAVKRSSDMTSMPAALYLFSAFCAYSLLYKDEINMLISFFREMLKGAVQ